MRGRRRAERAMSMSIHAQRRGQHRLAGRRDIEYLEATLSHHKVKVEQSGGVALL